MIHVIASITVKNTRLESFIEIFKANIPNVMKENGCIEYSATMDVETDITIQQTDKNVVTVIEKWESLSHLKAHFTAPHMLDYKSRVDHMVETVSLKILQES